MTGHRYITDRTRFLLRVESTLKEAQPDAFIQGMAMGADLLSGKIALTLGIPVISAMPWPTHYKSISKDWLDLYREVRDKSEEVYVVTEVDDYPGPYVYFKRNEWMIDEGDRVLAWWDGRKSGGTYGAIQYANKVGKPVRNIYANT
jgi:uncharacterized phage-like protein YoqJ